MYVYNLPQHWPAQTDVLAWARDMTPGTAALLLVGGLVFLLFGWYMFRALVTLNAALLGAYFGALLGQKSNAAVPGAFLAGFTAAALTWPLMKWAVAAMGGLFGALLGASLWRSFGLETDFAWAGALSGLILFGLISFIIFKGSVMMFTSLQGAVMLTFGLLGLVYKYQTVAKAITEQMTAHPFLLPACVFIPAVFGLLYQQTQSTTPADATKKK